MQTRDSPALVTAVMVLFAPRSMAAYCALEDALSRFVCPNWVCE